jgi:hypothetical protein
MTMVNHVLSEELGIAANISCCALGQAQKLNGKDIDHATHEIRELGSDYIRLRIRHGGRDDLVWCGIGVRKC